MECAFPFLSNYLEPRLCVVRAVLLQVSVRSDLREGRQCRPGSAQWKHQFPGRFSIFEG